MYNKELMDAKTSNTYDKMTEAIKALKKKHKELMKKAFNKTISEEEKKILKEVIKAHNAIEKARKKIWDNHSLVKFFLK